MSAFPLDPEVCALYLAYAIATDGPESDLFRHACQQIQTESDAFSAAFVKALDELEVTLLAGELPTPGSPSLRPIRVEDIETVRSHALRVLV